MNKRQQEIADKYAKRILAECQTGDNEVDHAHRDGLLQECLCELGAPQVADAGEYVEEEIGFWYAQAHQG